MCLNVRVTSRVRLVNNVNKEMRNDDDMNYSFVGMGKKHTQTQTQQQTSHRIERSYLLPLLLVPPLLNPHIHKHTLTLTHTHIHISTYIYIYLHTFISISSISVDVLCEYPH